MLPDVADWEDVDGLWSAGQEMFTRYNEVQRYIFLVGFKPSQKDRIPR